MGFVTAFNWVNYEQPLMERFVDVIDDLRTALYYAISFLFVVFTITSAVLSATFLLHLVVQWSQYKPNKFFWFLFQLTTFILLLSIANLLVNVSVIVGLLKVNIVHSDIFFSFICVSDFCHYSILFSNLWIAIQRGFAIFVPSFGDKFFGARFIFIWLFSIWLFSFAIDFVLMYFNCFHVHPQGVSSSGFRKLELVCENTVTTYIKIRTNIPMGIESIYTMVQLVLPLTVSFIHLVIFIKVYCMTKSTVNQKEVLILKQAILIFVAFQIPAVIPVLLQHIAFSDTDDILIKRFANTMEMIAGTVIPVIFFYKRNVEGSSRVSPASSPVGSDFQRRTRN